VLERLVGDKTFGLVDTSSSSSWNSWVVKTYSELMADERNRCEEAAVEEGKGL